MEEIKRGLIIDTPHIDNILSGRKTWEMRTTLTKQRGRIALIQKGSGTIVGIAEITDSLGPFSKEEMLANESKHGITPVRLNKPEVSKYNNAWVVKDAKRLKKPVPYKHKFGQVIWVNLDAETSAAVMSAI